MYSGESFCFGKKVSLINSLVNQEKSKNLIRRMILAAVAGCLMSGCIAFAGTTEVAKSFFGHVTTFVASGLLNAADMVMVPLMQITTMSTADVSQFVPGFDNSSPIGNFFIRAINAIAYSIAGVLVCCHIISYLISLAHGEKVESIPKMIWNAMFGIVLVISGKTFLTIVFDEIVTPLSSALSEGVSSVSFSFAETGSQLIGFGENTSAFDSHGIATLFAVLALLLIIWWNLIKLVLECAERYIICIFTINLSPLAFATMASENTRDTAKNWLKMFWSQCVLLILNIWVVGIARTALDNNFDRASNTEMIKWGLITFAYLKIAQHLDDMMQTAGLKITGTTGLDPISEASGLMRNVSTVFGPVASFAGHVAGKTLQGYKYFRIGKANNDKPIDGRENNSYTHQGESINRATYPEVKKAEKNIKNGRAYREKEINKNKGTLNAKSFDTDAYKMTIQTGLSKAGMIGKDTGIEKVTIRKDGNLVATAVKRNQDGKIVGRTDYLIGEKKNKELDYKGAKETLSMQITPKGDAAVVTTEDGKYLATQKVDDFGKQEWTLRQIEDQDGISLEGVAPDENVKKVIIPASGSGRNVSDAMVALEQFANENSFDTLAEENNKVVKGEMAKVGEALDMDDEKRKRFAYNLNWNTPIAHQGTEDYIKKNAKDYPELKKMIDDGYHVKSVQVSDGDDGNPPGSMVVGFVKEDENGGMSEATYVLTRPESEPEAASKPEATPEPEAASKPEAFTTIPLSQITVSYPNSYSCVVKKDGFEIEATCVKTENDGSTTWKLIPMGESADEYKRWSVEVPSVHGRPANSEQVAEAISASDDIEHLMGQNFKKKLEEIIKQKSSTVSPKVNLVPGDKRYNQFRSV